MKTKDYLLKKNFNPRAPCGARRWWVFTHHRYEGISTHAPLAGRDVVALEEEYIKNISTHAPLAGRDFDEKG